MSPGLSSPLPSSDGVAMSITAPMGPRMRPGIRVASVMTSMTVPSPRRIAESAAARRAASSMERSISSRIGGAVGVEGVGTVAGGITGVGSITGGNVGAGDVGANTVPAIAMMSGSVICGYSTPSMVVTGPLRCDGSGGMIGSTISDGYGSGMLPGGGVWMPRG